MTSQILDFSQELINQIANCILEEQEDKIGLWETQSKGTKRGVESDSENNGTESKSEQPATKSGAGTRNAEEQCILNLALTCSGLYSALSPYLFRHITLRNTKRSGQAIKYLCSTSQIAHTKALTFKAKALFNSNENYYDVENVLPEVVRETLRNFSTFPNLETLVIHFDFNITEDARADCDWSEMYIDLLGNERGDSDADSEEAEETHAWRALMKGTLEDVSAGGSDNVRELIYRGYFLESCSAFGSPAWNRWLRNLRSFKLRSYGSDNGAGWEQTTFEAFHCRIESLDSYFFNALDNVTRLAIIADYDSIVGDSHVYGCNLPLKPQHFPMLQNLELGYYFVQSDLLDFLSAHSSTLEHLKFSFCYCNSMIEDYDWVRDEGYLLWGDFFRAYASSDPVALRRVDFRPWDAPLKNGQDTDVDVEKVLNSLKDYTLREGTEARVFPYAEIDDKYGMLFKREEYNVDRALRFADMPGWRALLEIMQRNRLR